MKIAIITETYLPFIAGVSASTDSIARHMVLRGDDVTIITPKPVLPDTNKQTKKIHIVYCPSIKDPICEGKSFSPFPLPVKAIWDVLRKKKYDLLHIQEPGSVGWSALIIAKLLRIPVFGAWHSLPGQMLKMIKLPSNPLFFWLIKQYVSLFYNACNQVMVPTKTFAKYAKEVIKTSIVAISNGVETDKYRPLTPKENIRKKSQVNENSVVFMYLGRIDPDKEVENIIKALPLVQDNVCLFIAGGGKSMDFLKSLVRKLSVAEKVKWFGYLNEDEMINIYNNVDGFINMSPYETQSIVTLQAIACGLPVIVADAGALPELVEEGKSGFLVPSGDYRALAGKMNQLAKDKILRQKFGKRARMISYRHEKKEMLDGLRNYYLKLIQKQKKLVHFIK